MGIGQQSLKKKAWMLAVGAGMVSTVVLAAPECFDIVGSCTHAFVPGDEGYVVGGVCYSSCDTCFEVMIPGTQCQVVASVGGPVEFEGTIFQNPDGTLGCKRNGNWYIATVSADLECLKECLDSPGGPF